MPARPPTGAPAALLRGGGHGGPRSAGGVRRVGGLPSPLSEKSLRRVARVLVVEDDSDLAPVITRILARHGIDVLHAVTGEAALALCGIHPPDLLILDLGLPGIDGFSVVERLRAEEGARHLPLVVYTGRELGADDRRRLSLGPTEFLLKSRLGPAEFEVRVLLLLDATLARRPR